MIAEYYLYDIGFVLGVVVALLICFRRGANLGLLGQLVLIAWFGVLSWLSLLLYGLYLIFKPKGE